MFFERLFLKYNDNAKARKLILGQIVGMMPRAVVHLGDEVSSGTNDGSWEEIDSFVAQVKEHGADFLPIPGNHEYLFSSKKGISRFIARYPYAHLSGYSRQYANVAIVLLNSNFGELSEEERNGQLRWYVETLRNFERDSTVDFVIVGCHRPPFTNSRIVSGSEEIRNDYLPEFNKSTKCRLFIGGHSHAYEHFRINGKDFLVIGGGGGLQHPLRVGADAEYEDQFSTSEVKRMFHFITIKAWRDTMTVDLNMLEPDFRELETIPQMIFTRETRSVSHPAE